MRIGGGRWPWESATSGLACSGVCQLSILCNTVITNAQGRGEAVQVCNQTATNDQQLSHAGEGDSTFSSLSSFTLDQLVFFSKVYLRLDQPLAALEVR